MKTDDQSEHTNDKTMFFQMPVEDRRRAAKAMTGEDQQKRFDHHLLPFKSRAISCRGDELIVLVAGPDLFRQVYSFPFIARELLSFSIGRHDFCSISLPSSLGEISLRHLQVFMSTGNDGRPLIRVRDMSSEFGLRDANNAPVTTLAASDPFHCRIGSVVLYFVPPGFRQRLLHAKQYSDIPWAVPVNWISEKSAESLLGDDLIEKTCITIHSPEPKPDGRVKPPGRVIGRLRVKEDRRDVIDFEITERDVRRGVLLGRYSRCELIVNTGCISRVHAMIIEIDDRMVMVDAGSTNGLQLDGEERIVIGLSNIGSTQIQVCENVTVTWIPAPKPSYVLH